MEKIASELMGENVAIGVMLDSQAAVKKAMGRGLLNQTLGKALAGVELKEATTPRGHKGSFYMAVGDNNVGFFTIKQGFFKSSPSELLVKHPRSEVKALEIEPGMMSTVHVVLEDGTHYVFLCAKMNQKNLGKVKDLLFP